MTEVRPDRVLSHRGVVISILSSPDTGYTLLDYTAPPGFAGVQPHCHRETTEWFRVLAGSLAWTVDGHDGVAPAGGFFEVPRGARHVWRNASADEPLRMLVGFDRPGFDGYFRELIDMAAAAPEWPPRDPTPWIALGRRYDTHG
jgi:mannose-6-phosphate isomerase-like protein (cupin superfamily)